MADLKAIQTVIGNIEKNWGKGSIMRIDDERVVDVEVISTGSLGLDLALGVGGYPKGRIIEIIGVESGGKTTLAIHAIAEAQKKNEMAAFIDAEHSFDKYYAHELGVVIEGDNALYVSQPDHGEMALDIVERIVASGQFGIVVVDSVAALVPKSELQGMMGDSIMGVQARLMSQAMRKLTGIIKKSNCTVIFINQIRNKIGITWGSNEVTSGGNALKFYASVRLDIRPIGILKDKNEEVYGNRVRVKVTKNKLAVPFRKAEFDLIHGKGISKSGEILDIAVEMGLINKSGSWFSYGDTKLGQGRENVVILMDDNLEMRNEIEQKIINQIYGEVEE